MKVRMREHIFYTGQYAEVEVFPTIAPKKRTRKAKFRPTSEVQELINQTQAERKLRRLVHANFNGDDYAVHLTFSDAYEPKTLEEANALIKNYFRRLKRRYDKAGVEFKYIYAVECSSRFHFHAFLKSGVPRDEVEKCWGKGYANADRLQFAEYGVADLSKYVQKQHVNYKRWQGSRNLVHPVEREHFITNKEAQAYASEWNVNQFIEERFPNYYLVLDESVSGVNAINGFEYTSLFLCRKDAQLSFYSTSLAEREDRLKDAEGKIGRGERWIQMQLW